MFDQLALDQVPQGGLRIWMSKASSSIKLMNRSWESLSRRSWPLPPIRTPMLQNYNPWPSALHIAAKWSSMEDLRSMPVNK